MAEACRLELVMKQKLRKTVKSVAIISRFGLSTAAAVMSMVLAPAYSMQAGNEGGKGPQLLIGSDDDRQDDAAIQAGAAANQSLNRTDVISGGSGNDVIFGLNGNDVIDGGPGSDISQDGAITFADLTKPSAAFVPVSQQDVQPLNPLVAAMIR